MYRLMCCHKTPLFCFMRSYRFPDSGSRLDSEREARRYQVPHCVECTGGCWGGQSKSPISGRLSLEPWHQDRNMVVGASLHSQLNRSGRSGMARRPLPMLWYWPPWHPTNCDGVGTDLLIFHILNWKRATSSWLVTSSSMMVSLTWPSKPLPPCMYAMNYHIPRSFHAGGKGPSDHVRNQQYNSPSWQDGTEVRPPYPRSLADTDGHHSRHVCHEYWYHLLPEQVAREMSPDGGKYKKCNN